ncbi:MAG: sigma-54 dependent transcriptional regulator [Gemmatimonadota bacterium]
MASRVVVMDQAGGIAAQIREALKDRRCFVRQVVSEEEGQAAISDETSLLVLNPCVGPDTDFASLERLVREVGDVPVVILAGCTPVEAASRVLFPGAARVLRYPLSPAVLRQGLLGVMANGNGNGNRRQQASLSGLGEIVGGGASMQEVYSLIVRAARSQATVLLTGETGTGKDLVARTIHDLSSRRDGPFVVVSCADLTESLIESELFGHVRGSFTGATRDKVGLFEAARGGTVFLDEVADASPAVQARLLRAVEERCIRRVGSVESRPLDIRFIAASQVNLRRLVEQGRIREDLFYRLRVLNIPLPPLRERSEDIPALVARRFELLPGQDGSPRVCSPFAIEMLRGYPWPGNVRELFAALEAAATLKPSGTITDEDLPEEIRSAWSRGASDEGDLDVILQALEEADGRRRRAAEILGISRTTLWRRMRELGIA